MSNIFSNMATKSKNFFKDNFTEETNVAERTNITPRNSKEMTIGGQQASAHSSTRTQQSNVFDTSDDLCIIRKIKLQEDGGNYMLSVINRLEKGQLVVVDFSDSKDKGKDDQFHVLWGAVMALHGSYKILDTVGNLVLFTSNDNKISEDKSAVETPSSETV